MRRSILLFLLITSLTAKAQKRTVKYFLDPEVAAIVIEGEQCYRIQVETADTDQVTVTAFMEGEYQNDVLIQTETLGKTLNIRTGFTPSFSMPNDKLGAHKVLSIDLRVVLPHHQRLTVFAGYCQVRTAGSYRSLKVRMNDGTCKLSHTAERTEVRTKTAPIYASVHSGTVEAESRRGTVNIEPIPAGMPQILLQSGRGDIRVTRKP